MAGVMNHSIMGTHRDAQLPGSRASLRNLNPHRFSEFIVEAVSSTSITTGIRP
jgi:hypothetical protein